MTCNGVMQVFRIMRDRFHCRIITSQPEHLCQHCFCVHACMDMWSCPKLLCDQAMLLQALQQLHKQATGSAVVDKNAQHNAQRKAGIHGATRGARANLVKPSGWPQGTSAAIADPMTNAAPPTNAIHGNTDFFDTEPCWLNDVSTS